MTMVRVGVGAQTRGGEAAAIDTDVLDTLLGFHLRRAQLMNFRRFHREVRDPEATPTQFAMLVLMEANPGMSQVDVGGVLDMDRATTMAVVGRLKSAGWIRKERSTEDRRKHRLFVTRAGTEALKRMKSAVVALEEDFAAGLSAREFAELLRLIRKLCATAANQQF